MHIMHVNTLESQGGAARSAFRLHKGLQEIGVESRMLVQQKTSDDPSVAPLGSPFSGRVQRRLDRLPREIYPRRQSVAFSSNYLPSLIARTLNAQGADLLHLHWIGLGVLPISAWPHLKPPIVWTLHDSWAFTGGCHVPHDCRRYEEQCGRCPILGSNREADLTRWTWYAKARALPRMSPVIVTPSVWLADSARQSSLLGSAEIHTIPYGLDVETFRPLDRAAARTALNLPQGRPLIAFGAMSALTDWNKGADLLTTALNHLDTDADFLIFGSDAVPEGLSRTAHTAGTLSDEQRIAQVYAAADVMVVPSRSENLPLTVMEPLACGVPVVAFRIGGIPDLIEHQVNGYLAEPFDTADLARGIAWVLEDPERHTRLRAAARAKAEREYEITHIARRYLALYEDILSRPK